MKLFEFVVPTTVEIEQMPGIPVLRVYNVESSSVLILTFVERLDIPGPIFRDIRVLKYELIDDTITVESVDILAPFAVLIIVIKFLLISAIVHILDVTLVLIDLFISLLKTGIDSARPLKY
jgi:hypothetical protein